MTRFTTMATALVCLALSGCAGWPPGEKLPDVRPERQRRAQEAISSFQQHRVEAEYAAAVAQWQRGDSIDCRQSLEGLLQRDPHHVASLVLLGEVLLLEQQPEAAIKHLKHALRHEPHHAQAMHLTAVALDETGNESNALDFYRRAAEAEPENPVFQASYLRAEEDARANSGHAVPAPSAPRDDALTGDAIDDIQPVAYEEPVEQTGCGGNIAWIDDATDIDREHESAELAAPFVPVMPHPPLPKSAAAERTAEYTLPKRGTSMAASAQPSVRLATQSGLAKTVSVAAPPALPNASGPEVTLVTAAQPLSQPMAEMDAEPAAKAPAVTTSGSEDSDDDESTAWEHFDWAQRALQAGAYETAGRRFTEAVRASDDAQLCLQAVAQLLQHNQADLAAQVAAVGAKAFPDVAAVHRAKGASHYRLGQWREAQVALEQALSLDKSDALAYFLLGSTLGKLGQHDDARRHLRQAQRLDQRYLGL